MAEYTEIFGRRIKDLTTPNSDLDKVSEGVDNIKIPAGNFPTELSDCEGLRLIDLKKYLYTPVDPEIYADIIKLNDALDQTKIFLSDKITAEEQRATLEESKLASELRATESIINSKINTVESNLEVKIGAVGVGNKAYKTYALMDADKANIPAKSKVTVTNDATTSNNGDWQWDGTAFTKSAYDSLTQAKNYTDAKYFDLDSLIGFSTDFINIKDAQALNGATLNAYKITIPVGQTGNNSYAQNYIDIGDTTSSAGRTITLYTDIKTSDNFLASTPSVRNQVNAKINGVTQTNKAIPNTTIVTQIDSTTIRVKADYLIVGATSEQVTLGLQIAASALNQTTTEREFSVLQSGLRYKDISVFTKINETKDLLKNINVVPIANDDVTENGQALNGATKIGKGLNIPAGQTGLTSYLRLCVKAQNLATTKCNATLIALVETSDDFFEKYTSVGIHISKYTTENFSNSPTILSSTISRELKKISKNLYQVSATFESTAEHAGFALWFQLQGTSDSIAERYVKFKSMYLRVNSSDTTSYVPAVDVLAKEYKNQEFSRKITYLESVITSLSNPNGYAKVVTVKPSGGDYTHIKLALDAITDASASKRYMIAVYSGTYTGYAEWHTKDHVDIVGIGRRDEIVISYDSGDAADYDTVRNTSLCWMASESMFKNLTLKVKNGRYVIHLESNGNKEDITCRIEICSVIHEGNATEAHWWSPSQYAVGAGLSAGQKVILRGSYFAGRGGGFSWHTPNNRIAYTKACSVDAESCVFENTATRTDYPHHGAFSIKPVCKGAADTTRLVGNKFVNGEVYYSAGEWLDTTDTTTNRAQIEVYGHGNVNFEFWSSLPYQHSVI